MAKLDDYSELLEALGPHARELLQSGWLEASRSFTEKGLTRYLEGAREIATAGLGWSVVLAFLRETPAVAREVGEDAAFSTIDSALAVYAHTDARTAEQVFSTCNFAARRLGDAALYGAYLEFLAELASLAPVGIAPILLRLDRLLEQLTLDGLRRWALLGVQSHMRDPNAQARYFTLDSEEGRLQTRQRLAQLGQLGGRCVNLELGDGGDLQRLAKNCADVFQMREQSLGVVVALAAMHRLAVEAEGVVHAAGFAARLRHEALAQGLEGAELAFVDLEVGHQGAAGVGALHRDSLSGGRGLAMLRRTRVAVEIATGGCEQFGVAARGCRVDGQRLLGTEAP